MNAKTRRRQPTRYKQTESAKKQRMLAEYQQLCEAIPNPVCALVFHNPFELLIATVLSAQTTDKRVNSVTPELFATFPTPTLLADASLMNVEQIIRPLGFYHTKAQHIIGLAAMLVDRYAGEVPSRMEDLVVLPGVGRKTANVVLGNAFHVPGFPVDTHVMRVTGRLRWRDDWDTARPSASKVEREITSYFPAQEWTNLSHRLIALGRSVCRARHTYCERCPLRASCPSSQVQ